MKINKAVVHNSAVHLTRAMEAQPPTQKLPNTNTNLLNSFKIQGKTTLTKLVNAIESGKYN